MARKPKPPSEADQWLAGAPDGDSPIMSELARFHAKFASLEVSLNTLMAFALGQKQEVAHAILCRIRNIADRVDIIAAVGDVADHLTESQKSRIHYICKRALALNARRNVYAHGFYEHRGSTMRVTPYAYSPRKAQPEVLKLKRVQGDTEEIDGLLVATLLVAGLIPQDHIDEVLGQRAEPQAQADPKTPPT